VNGEMFGLQGPRGRIVRRMWASDLYVAFHDYIRRAQQVDEDLLRELYSEEDARLGGT
jgi:hypothetical protein